MEIAYWIVAGILALFYLYAGGLKLIRSRDELRPMMAWVDAMPFGLVRLVGALEVAGALGLVLPPLTGAAPVLALLAALGFVVLQVLAAGLHLSRGEARDVWLNAVLVAVAAVTAWLATTW
jgi:hypothetical protein